MRCKMKNRIIEFLNGKERVSIPDIQMAFSCSYAVAKSYISVCREHKWVSSNIVGIYSAVNHKHINRVDIPEAECFDVWRKLTNMEYLIFKDISRNSEKEKDRSRIRRDLNPQAVANLIEYGYIHEFDGEYYLSLSEKTMNRIESIASNKNNILLWKKIADAIALGAIENVIEPDDVMSAPLIPRDCARYIEQTMARYKLCGSKPEGSFELIKEDEEEKIIMFDMVEIFARDHDYESKEEFDMWAKKSVQIIDASPICPEEFKNIVKKVANEIIEELTYANLMEIKSLAGLGKNDDDDDDDDDDYVWPWDD